MHLIIAGCEYSGTTTLSRAFAEWATQNVEGGPFGIGAFHDHWKLPHLLHFTATLLLLRPSLLHPPSSLLHLSTPPSSLHTQNVGSKCSDVLSDFQANVLAKELSSWCTFIARR